MSKPCPVGTYLRGRGIRAEEVWARTISELDVFALPADQGAHLALEQLFHQAHRGMPPRMDCPSLGVVARDGQLGARAIARVLLTADGEKLRRANGDGYPKYVTGELGGAYFRTNGERSVVVCEGPEDALTIRQETERRVMAKLGSLSGLRVEDFEDEDEIVIAIDRDPLANIEARRGTWRAIARLNRERDGVLVATPPPMGTEKSDWNALLMAGRSDEIHAAITNPVPAHQWLRSNPLPSVEAA